MGKIKLFFIDLDGTFVNSFGKTPKRNILTIKKLSENGIQIVITTGRSITSALKCANNITNKTGVQFSYIISSNGGYIYNCQTKQCENISLIDHIDTKNIYEFCKQNNI
jgi:HAD superfamily hydrolase (TIGR01484 family)